MYRSLGYGTPHSIAGCIVVIFYKEIFVYKEKIKEGETLNQAELRELYRNRLKSEKQCYISKQTGINVSTLSQFKNGHIDLYDHLLKKLESYLLND